MDLSQNCKRLFFFTPPFLDVLKNLNRALFPFRSHLHERQFYGLTSGFSRLIMKTKYVCYVLVSLNVNFNDKRTMWTIILIIKIGRWGGRKKSIKVTEYLRSGWVFFLQTNFDFLTSHF